MAKKLVVDDFLKGGILGFWLKNHTLRFQKNALCVVCFAL